MKRPTSRISSVLILAVAAYFVFFLLSPGVSTSPPEGETIIASAEEGEPKNESIVRESTLTPEPFVAEKRTGKRSLSNRPELPLPSNPVVRNWAGGPRPATSVTTKSGFVPGSSSQGRALGGRNSQAARTRVSSALSEVLALQEANHSVEAEIPVIIQSHPDSYSAKSPPNALAGARSLERVNAHAGRMSAKELRRLVEQGDADYITLDMPLHGTNNFETVADDFDPGTDYSGSDGSVNWSGNWLEFGESNGPGRGRVRTSSSSRCASGECLKIGGDETSINNIGLYRQTGTFGATSITLTFSYRRYVDDPGGSVAVEVSDNGGSQWSTLATYSLNGDDSSQVSQSFDLSGYASVNMQVRFRGIGSTDEDGYIYFDNVQISYEIGPSSISSGSNALLATIGLEQEFSGSSAHNRIGYGGHGIGVAVFDSGIGSVGATDIKSKLTAVTPTRIDIIQTKFPAQSVDFTSGTPVVASDYNDGYGHGTHVSGIIGGQGNLSSGQYSGVAPGVSFLHAKVLDDGGAGYTSNLIAAIDWMITNKDVYNIRVANLSVGHPAIESFETDPLCQAVRNMVAAGIVTVVSAGNLGKASGYPQLWGASPVRERSLPPSPWEQSTPRGPSPTLMTWRPPTVRAATPCPMVCSSPIWWPLETTSRR